MIQQELDHLEKRKFRVIKKDTHDGKSILCAFADIPITFPFAFKVIVPLNYPEGGVQEYQSLDMFDTFLPGTKHKFENKMRMSTNPSVTAILENWQSSMQEILHESEHVMMHGFSSDKVEH